MKKFLRIFLLLFSFFGYSQPIDTERLKLKCSIEGIQVLEGYDEDSFLVQGLESCFGDVKEIAKFDPTAKIYIFDRLAESLEQINFP